MFNLWLPWETVRPQVLNLSCALTFFTNICSRFQHMRTFISFHSSYNNFLLSVLWRTCIQSRSFHVGCWCCDWHVLQYVHSLFLVINFFLLIFFVFRFLASSLHHHCIFFASSLIYNIVFLFPLKCFTRVVSICMTKNCEFCRQMVNCEI